VSELLAVQEAAAAAQITVAAVPAATAAYYCFTKEGLK
jgi:hypothetical protein